MAPKKRTASGQEARSTRARTGPLTLDAQVSRAIYDNFREWPHELVYVRKVDGLTLEEAIRAKKAESLEKNTPIGACFYQSLKAKYRSCDDPLSQLTVSDPSQTVGPELMRAMIACKRQHPDRTGMQSYFVSSRAAPNQMEVVGIFKFALGLKASCCKQAALALDFLRWVAATKVDALFPKEWAHMVKAADRILMLVWKRARAEEKMEAAIFTKLHKHILGTIIPVQPLEEVLACQGKWSQCRDSLHRVASSSEVGLSLFGFAVGLILSEQVGDTMKANLDTFANRPIDEKAIAAVKTQIMAAVDAIPNISLLPKLREVEYLCRGVTLQAKVGSIVDETNFKVACVWKGLAVAQGSLKPFLYEDMVIRNPVSPGSGQVDEAIPSAAAIARDAVATSIKSAAPENGEMLKQVVQDCKQGWLSFDRDFLVELAMLESVFGEGAKMRLKAKLLESMSSEKAPKTPSESLQLLEKTIKTPEFQLSWESHQGKFPTMMTMIGRIVDGRPPCCEVAAQDDMLKDAVSLLPYFVKHTTPATASQAEQTAWGADALKLMYDQAKGKVDAGIATLDEVAPFHIFGYLAKPDDQKHYQALHDSVRDRIGALGAKKKPQKRAATTSPGPGGSSDDGAVAAALAMFS